MKKHDWLSEIERPATRTQDDMEVKKWRSATFDRIAADPGKEWRDDGCGAVVAWENVSARNKASWLSLRAASYDVSYERYARAVQDAIGGRDLTADEHRSLRDHFEAARKLVAPIEPEPELELEKNNGRVM